MSLKKIGEVKSDKGFKIWDLIIYGAIILLVAVLFIVVFTTADTSPLKGIRIYVSSEVVYEYDFEDGEKFRNEQRVEVIEEGSEKVILKVSSDGGGYNTVEINKGGSVKITDANCSGKKDCVYMPELKNNSGMLYCLPHRLKIVPFDFDADSGNIII